MAVLDSGSKDYRNDTKKSVKKRYGHHIRGLYKFHLNNYFHSQIHYMQ
jgi:hypothetical protein